MPDSNPKPTLVTTLSIVVLAVLALSGIYLIVGPVPEGFDRPSTSDVLAIIGTVVAPIVAVAAAYYGVSIALKTSAESRQLIEQSTKGALEAADSFTTAVSNITIDLHNQNLDLIQALQRTGAFSRDLEEPAGVHIRDTASGAVQTPRPRPASEHANTGDVGLPA